MSSMFYVFFPAYTSLESMADAVTKAEVVLVSLSQKYKDSPACRTGELSTISDEFALIMYFV